MPRDETQELIMALMQALGRFTRMNPVVRINIKEAEDLINRMDACFPQGTPARQKILGGTVKLRDDLEQVRVDIAGLLQALGDVINTLHNI